MFKSPFSFNGRIRRKEYALSVAIYFGTYLVIAALTGITRTEIEGFGSQLLFLICLVPLVWFLWAQGAKRCHDVGVNGWYQIIPFYFLYLLFKEGVSGINQYGNNPKTPEEVDFDFIKEVQSPGLREKE